MPSSALTLATSSASNHVHAGLGAAHGFVRAPFRPADHPSMEAS
jgi:hypothetical protein